MIDLICNICPLKIMSNLLIVVTGINSKVVKAFFFLAFLLLLLLENRFEFDSVSKNVWSHDVIDFPTAAIQQKRLEEGFCEPDGVLPVQSHL